MPAESAGARAARGLIRLYQISLSGLVGRQCRHLPSCSDYCDQAIARHGLWAGGWMGLARLSRCRPWGSAGYDPAPERKPEGAGPWTPWRYGVWTPRAAARIQLLAASAAERASNDQREPTGKDSSVSR